MREEKCRVVRAFAGTTIYVYKRGNEKTLQTLHKPYISPATLLIFSALYCVGFAFQNPAQTIHKPYTELYIESQRVKETKRGRVEEREGGA